MKQKFLRMLGLLGLAVLLSGCYASVDGRTRAGVPLIKDKIDSRYERPVQQVFLAARKVLEFNGSLTSENTVNNSLEAKVDTRTVWVRVTEVEPNVSQVTVQARTKNKGADVDLASEVSKQIALQLSSMR